MTKRYVILSACAKESVIPLKERRIAARLTALAMTERKFTAHPVTFTATNQLVILSAKHERIRNTLKGETDCRGAKAPRNDKEARKRIAAAVCTASQ